MEKNPGAKSRYTVLFDKKGKKIELKSSYHCSSIGFPNTAFAALPRNVATLKLKHDILNIYFNFNRQ
jgi:hypothetical protein